MSVGSKVLLVELILVQAVPFAQNGDGGGQA